MKTKWRAALVQAAVVGAAILSTSDEKVYQMAHEAQCRLSDELKSSVVKAHRVTGLVIGALFFAAARILESRGKLEEELEGTV